MIVGAGKLGVYLGRTMEKKGHEIILIDKDKEKLKRVLKYNTFNVALGDATDTNVLEETGIESVDVFISTTSMDEMNMILCLMAKKLGAKMTICISDSTKYLNHVDFMGDILNIDLILNPKLETARYILRSIYAPELRQIDALDHGRIRKVLLEVKEKDEMKEKTLREISDILSGNMLVVAILRGNEVLVPKGDVKILQGDRIHLLGSNDAFITFFAKRNGISPKENFFIIGGDNLAYFLVERLEKLGHEVKVIEKNNELVQALRLSFPNCEAVYADGFDLGLLKEEGLSEYDNLILLTDRDETNLILGDLGKSLGIKRVYSKVYNKQIFEYGSFKRIEKVFSMEDILGKLVENFIQTNDRFIDSKIGTLNKISQSKIKIEELVMDEKSDYLNMKISEIPISKDSLIAFISRKNKILIPRGDDVLKRGDVIIYVTLK